MAALSAEIRTHIIERLACFATHTEVRDDVKARFGVDVPYPQISALDPDRVAGARDLAQKWKDLHAKTREAFLRERAKIPIAHRSVRLERLWRMAQRAETQGNLVLAASLYEQAAKEEGDYYTNRRVVIPGDPASELGKLLGMDPADIRDAVRGGVPPGGGDASE